MKSHFIKSVILAGAFLALTFSANASMDMFGRPRFVVLDPGTTVITTTAAVTTTNNPVDIHGLDGVVAVYMACMTNSSTSTGVSNKPSYWLEQSSDLTNWTQLTSCAVITSTTSEIISSFVGSTAKTATNSYLFPGTLTTPTAASAGFASAYMSPAAFTSTSSVFTNSVTGGTALVGFVASDAKRFIRTACSVPSGTNVCSFSAVLVGLGTGSY